MNSKTPASFAKPLMLSALLMSLPWVYRRMMASRLRARNRINPATGIEVQEKITLGGMEQWISIRGQNRNNPILLFLHGGPGVSLMPFQPVWADLEKRYTVVHWDQRGCGKSWSLNIDPQTMTIDQFIADAVELIETLKVRLNQERVYLVGHSFGSILGLSIAMRHPQLLHAYVGVGQAIKLPESEHISYEFVRAQAEKRGDLKTLATLQDIGHPPYKNYKGMLKERQLVNKFGGQIYCNMDNFKIAHQAFISPEYSVWDHSLFMKGIDFSSKCLWDEIYRVDFTTRSIDVNVPVFFIEGRHDYTVPSEVLVDYFPFINATRGKDIIWFDESAHFPMLEEPDKFVEVLCQRILQSSYDQTMVTVG